MSNFITFILKRKSLKLCIRIIGALELCDYSHLLKPRCEQLILSVVSFVKSLFLHCVSSSVEIGYLQLAFNALWSM